MKYALFELIKTTVGNTEGNLLRRVDHISWSEYDNKKGYDDSGNIKTEFDSIEDCNNTIKPLLEKEKTNDYFNVGGVDSYSDYVLLPIINFSR